MLAPPTQVRAFRERHPEHVIVSYINTSVEVKAESDILCTSRNAVKIVNSIPAEKPILFLPDINLGNYVKQQTGRREYADLAGSLHRARDFPGAQAGRGASGTSRTRWLPRIRNALPDVLAMADFIGSTSAIVDWCVAADATEFIVMTESGVGHSLRLRAPEKRFYFVANENCNCSECPYMRRNTLEKLRDALADLAPRIELVPKT